MTSIRPTPRKKDEQTTDAFKHCHIRSCLQHLLIWAYSLKTLDENIVVTKPTAQRQKSDMRHIATKSYLQRQRDRET